MEYTNWTAAYSIISSTCAPFYFIVPPRLFDVSKVSLNPAVAFTCFVVRLVSLGRCRGAVEVEVRDGREQRAEIRS